MPFPKFATPFGQPFGVPFGVLGNTPVSSQPAPTAAFTYVDNGDGTVTFTDTSTGDPTSWAWDFGDSSGTSTDQNPTYDYGTGGVVVNVSLVATNAGGDSEPAVEVVSVAYFAAGPATITPTLGSELATNGGFESTFSGGLGANWTQTGTLTPAQETTVVRSGANAQKLTVTSGGIFQNAASNAANWYRFQSYAHILSGTAEMRITASSGPTLSTTGAYLELLATGRGAANRPFFTSAAATYYLDDISVKQITLATLFSVIANAYVPRVIKAEVTRTAFTQAGIAHYSDDSNFVVAYLDGFGNAVLLKRVGGTYTAVATQAVTYSAGAALELDYDPTAKTYTVKYNGATVINAASVTDAVFVTATGSRLFSTYDANSFADIEASPNPS